MKLFRTIRYAGPAALLVLLFAAPAFAQFEVSPDHFDNPHSTTKKKPVQKTRAQQGQQGTAKQSADGKSSTNAAAVAASSASKQASQPSVQATATSTATKASGTATTKLQSHSKTRTSPPAQQLSAKAASVSPE